MHRHHNHQDPRQLQRRPTQQADDVATEHSALVQALSQSVVAAEHHHRAVLQHLVTGRDDDDSDAPAMMRWGGASGSTLMSSSSSGAAMRKAQQKGYCRWKDFDRTAAPSTLRHSAEESAAAVVVVYPPWDAPSDTWRPPSTAAAPTADSAPDGNRAAKQKQSALLADLDPSVEMQRRMEVKRKLLSHRPPPYEAAVSTTSQQQTRAAIPATPSDAELLQRCFRMPGLCDMSELGKFATESLIATVFQELRRPADVPNGLAAVAINHVNCTGLKHMPRHTTSDPDVTYHPLTPYLAGIMVVGDPAARAHRVKRLTLDQCGLEDADVERIAAAIRSPAFKIVQLSLRANYISPIAGNSVKKAVKYNTTLRELDLSENPWFYATDMDYSPSGEEVLRVIAQRLQNNHDGVSNLNPIKRLMK